jgi:hypothetical protein
MVESEHSAVRAAAGWPDPQDTEKRTDGSQSVWDGVFTDEQAEGAEMAPPLAGSAFSANWDGLTLGDLFERMRVSMPQDNPGSLSRQQYVDVLTYILSYNKFPAGKTELARETEVLKQIRFLALKP